MSNVAKADEVLAKTGAGAMLVGIGAAILCVPFYGFLPFISVMTAISGLALTGRALNAKREQQKKVQKEHKSQIRRIVI